MQVETAGEGLRVTQAGFHAVAGHAALVVIGRLDAHDVGIQRSGAHEDVPALLVEGIDGHVQAACDPQVRTEIGLVGRFLAEVGRRELREEGAPGTAEILAVPELAVGIAPAVEPEAVRRNVVRMLDTGRSADLSVVQDTGFGAVGIDVTECEGRGEGPFGRIGTVGTVGREDQVGHEAVGVVVVRGELPVGAVPGIALSVTDFALHVVAGIGGEMVAVLQLGGILEPGVDRSHAPLGIHPVVEHELVLHRAHDRFLHDAVRIIPVPPILISLRAVLDGVGGVVVGAAGIELQAGQDEIEVLDEGDVGPDLALVGLGEARAGGLGDEVEVAPGLAAAPDVALGLDREGQGRHLVQMPPGVVRIHVRDAVGLHEQGEDVRADLRGAGHLEVHVGADVRLGIAELGIPIPLVRVLVQAAGVGIVQQGVVFHFLGAAVHGHETVRLAGGVLEDFLLPVDVRIDERIAPVLELLQLGVRVSGRGSVVAAGDVQGVGVVVGADHVGRLRIELDLVGGAGLDVETAVGHAALGLDEEDAIDGLMAVQGHGGGIPEDGHALHLFHRQAVDRTLLAIHQDEDVPFTGGLGAADVEAGATAFLSLEARVLQGGQAEELAVERVGEADGGGPLQLFGGDGIGRGRRQELRLFDPVAQIHRLRLLVGQHHLGLGAEGGCAKSQ